MEYKDVERYRHVNFVKGICIVRFDAPLLFTNVEHFRAMIENVSKHWNNVECNSPTTEESSATEDEEVVDKYRRPSCTRPRKFLIVDCSGFVYVDMMGVNCLKEIYEELIIRGIRVFFAAPKAPVRELFEAAGLYNSVKKSNFYPTVHDAMFFAQHRRSLATLAWMRSNESSYDTVVLSDDSTQSDSPRSVDEGTLWRCEVSLICQKHHLNQLSEDKKKFNPKWNVKFAKITIRMLRLAGIYLFALVGDDQLSFYTDGFNVRRAVTQNA
ncbi:STAS domain protein [Ancylostoma duodenale]|uniref:STAS domain protein n=1 Tax=Ancylostoma duodenale TaxID=51022 RepID=A0A0C2CTK8_9BILA|nr:STAS domain protein [Ancylostoma duodenale]